jgi:hypothetical protein
MLLATQGQKVVTRKTKCKTFMTNKGLMCAKTLWLGGKRTVGSGGETYSS